MSRLLDVGITTPIGKLYGADEAARSIGISGIRLMELALAEIAPHHHIDNGPPVFIKDELRAWAKDNLYLNHSGERIPSRVTVVSVTENKPPEYRDVPTAIRLMWSHLGCYKLETHAPCVYFLCAGDEVIYVGQSITLAGRISTHMCEAVKNFDRVFFLPVDPVDLDDVERALIKALRPVENKQQIAKTGVQEHERQKLAKYNVSVSTVDGKVTVGLLAS
jgi:hypothetical protein